MRDPYEDNEAPVPYQDSSGQRQVPNANPPGQGQNWVPDQAAGWQSPNAYQPEPGQMPPSPMMPPNATRRSPGGARAGAIVLLVVLLAVIFGVGLFAGWQFGRTSAASGTGGVGTLEPSTAPTATVPALSSNNIEAMRQAVIAEEKP